MRRLPTFPAVALAAVLLASGCGIDTTSDQKGTSESPVQATVGEVGNEGDFSDLEDICGDSTKPMKVALADGFGGNSWRKDARAEFEDEASKCPNIETAYTDAAGNAQQAIADLNSLVAQGYDAIIVYPDSGQALLPAIKDATEAGVKVVPYGSSPGGTPGEDYTDYVGMDFTAYGKILADWAAATLGGKGKVAIVGGPAGNTYSAQVFAGAKGAFAEHKGIELLNQGEPITTDWTPATTQRVVAGLITKYSQIDAIVSDYSAGAVGGIRAFLAADKDIPVWASNDSNEFACLWHQHSGDMAGYEIGTVSSHPWISRVALRKAVAGILGVEDPEPSIFVPNLLEDSIAGVALEPKCDESLPPDAILSSQLSIDQLRKLYGS